MDKEIANKIKERLIDKHLPLIAFNGAMLALLVWMWYQPSFREWWNTYEPSGECLALRAEMEERGVIR